jgi:hypothetical protein
MAGKPFQSSLIPYQKEIAELRGGRPPVSYARIAAMLREKYGLSIQRAAIAKFLKVRSGGRKVYFFRKEVERRKAAAAQAIQLTAQPSARSSRADANETSDSDFQFTYSERYNLTRLPPEEAAARRKKLEEQGH